MVWATITWYIILLVPLLPLMAELLQGSTWTGWVIRCIAWSRIYFRIAMQFSKSTMPPFTQLKLFNHGLKSMKVNFNIFPGQHNLRVWTSLYHSGRFWRLEWGTDCHPRHLYRNMNMFYRKIRIKFRWRLSKNLYESISGRIAVVLEAKGGPTPY
jgi:hypothetical protein